LNKCRNKKKTHAQIKTIEQRYKQVEHTRTDKNNLRVFSSCMYLCSVAFICACVFLLYVPLFGCLHLCVCFPYTHTHRSKQKKKGTNKKGKKRHISKVYRLVCSLFLCFDLCVCVYRLVCTFIPLFLSSVCALFLCCDLCVCVHRQRNKAHIRR
jgi:uncharacterized protein YqhQ